MWVDWSRNGLCSSELVWCVVAVEVLGTHLRWDVNGCHFSFRKTCELDSTMMLARSSVGFLQCRSACSYVINADAVRELGLGLSRPRKIISNAGCACIFLRLVAAGIRQSNSETV